MNSRLAILGAGGHGRVVAEAAALSGWKQIYFFDDAYPEKRINLAWPICGTSVELFQQLSQFDAVIVAIGNNDRRLLASTSLAEAGTQLATIIHPNATVSHYARIGGGSVVLAGAIVGTNAALGAAVIVNTASSVDHDCTIGDGVHISPGARLAGGVVVDDRTWIGMGALIREGTHIAAGATIGAGSVVLQDVEAGSMVFGVPARARSD